MPSQVKGSARRLLVVLHQTVAKNAGGEEWSKAVRELVKAIHVTADHVFRAVIEDWESATGYFGEAVDVNQELAGGGNGTEDLPPWKGVFAGAERLTGLLEMLAEYLKKETSTTVSVPLGSIIDVVTRMLSIAMPSSDSSSRQGSARLHPAIDRDERDGLSCCMSEIYVAAFELVNTIAERLQEAFMSLSQGILDQLVWVFHFGKSTPEFRLVSYVVLAKILQHVGQSLDRTQAGKLGSIIRSCCNDLLPVDPSSHTARAVDDAGKKSHNHNANQNADTFLQNKNSVVELKLEVTNLSVAARDLLPLLLSHIPQQYLDISLRSMIERTAILSRNKDAMLASILSPFVGKNGKALASVLPHLTREFGEHRVVEILLRPRMPLLPSSGINLITNDAIQEESEDEDMDYHSKPGSIQEDLSQHNDEPVVSQQPGLGPAPAINGSNDDVPTKLNFNHPSSHPITSYDSTSMVHAMSEPSANRPASSPMGMEDTRMDSGEDSSDEESVHLTMELDTDSE